MPSTTESATCSRPAAGTPGMITQRTQGNAYLLPVCLCPCYLSASLICCPFLPPPLVFTQCFSHRHSSPAFTFDLLFYSFLCSGSHHLRSCLFAFLLFSFGPFLSVVSLSSFLFGLLVFTPLSFYPLQSFSPFFSELICSSFLTGLDSSCFYSSPFSIPLCSIL